MTMNKAVKSLVIVGGGTAGWLSAGIIAAEHKSHSSQGIQLTLIESPDINPIGVGEGTWPTMRHTLQSIGISELDFLNCCEASFKQGSQFIDWVTGDKDDSYYHPFVAPHGFGQSNISGFWQKNATQIPFAHATSFQPHLCDNHRAPKQPQTPEYAAVANYGYHLNAAKFAALLQQHCTKNLGVKHIVDHVTQVNGDLDGNIETVSTKAHGNIQGDLFIDCSGSKALLLGEHYQIGFVHKKKILFNDRAIAVQAPYENNDEEIASHTLSTAQDSGWIWDIGLPTRRGVGYTYASDYLSDDKAEQALKSYLSKSLSTKTLESLSFKRLSFVPGYREKFWHKNCVAIGMAAGFLEPLEASALALVELSAKMVAKELPANTAIMPITEQRFNKRFHYRWQRIIEFLKLHYVLSRRQGSQYWLDNRSEETIPPRLRQLLTLWQYQAPSYNDFTEIEEIFPAASYQYILYGMGFITEEKTTLSQYDNDQISRKNVEENQKLCQKYLSGLPSNRELLNYLTQHKINN